MGSDDLDAICEDYLSRKDDREKVKDVVQRCLKKGYDHDKFKSRILDCILDDKKAEKVISAVGKIYPELRKKSKFVESKDDRRDRDRRETSRRRDDRDKDSKDKYRSSDRDRKDDRDRTRKRESDRVKYSEEEEPKKRKKFTDEPEDADVTEEKLRAKELMYKAQQEIETRKRQLGMTLAAQVGLATPLAELTTQTKNVALRPQEAQMFFSYSMDKKSRVEELKAKLAANKTVSNLVTLQQKAPVMTPLPEEAEEIIKKKEVVHKQPEEESKFLEFLDPRISARGAERKKRAFTFHEKGEFEKLANKQRASAKLEKLQAEISQAAKSTGISSAVKLAMVTPAGTTGKSSDTVPEVEWWDQVVLEGGNYDSIPELSIPTRFKDTISELVEHPIKLKAPTDPLVPQYLKVYLTAKERKKIRRQNRKEMLKEKTEKIRLGLEKAPEPKVKISNLMRVLGSEAVQDPTKMEAHARKQMEERLRKHQQANAERKLTDEQKAAKKTKKISEDTSLNVLVSVYRIKSLLNASKKFKVETNARQLQMSGIILMHKNLNVVVVEGGPKQQKFYKNLMMNRIKWEDEIIGQKKEAEKDAPGERNQCTLIWEGLVKKRNFKELSVITATLEKNARDLFEKHSCAQYWDLAYSTSVLLDDESTGL